MKELFHIILGDKMSFYKKICNIVKKKEVQEVKSNIQNKTELKNTQVCNYGSVHYLLSLLKKYGINNIVTSPGAQNAAFNLIAQEDTFFNLYSVVDERSASYVALGIAFETKKPVVIACTEATASRNYLSGLTEAFYKRAPIIACTFYNPASNDFSLSPQHVSKKSFQSDILYMSVDLPTVINQFEKRKCLTLLNAALVTALNKNCPVHINCPSVMNIKDLNSIHSLPNDIWSVICIQSKFNELSDLIKNKKVAIFIGSNFLLTDEDNRTISFFAQHMEIPVICDHTSNYTGANKVLSSLLSRVINKNNKPDILLDLGGISGDYTVNSIFQCNEIWRISKEKDFNCRFNIPIKKLLFSDLSNIFSGLLNKENKYLMYYSLIKQDINKFHLKDLPFSMPYIAKLLSQNIPNNSSLHLAILNSLRCMNYFNLDTSISVTSNVGGFGIDGPVSTLVGQSFINKNKVFGLIGDLAFFYDMNILGNKHIKNNIRLLLVNNNKGAEFFISYLGQIDSKKTRLQNYVSAGGHYSKGAQFWAQSCDFYYMSARSKSEFDSKIHDFCNKDYGKPVLFECFTSVESEDIALKYLQVV